MQTATIDASAALRRTRRMASAVLAGLAAVFLLTHLLPDSGSVHLIRAMAEAGMVGGLADWFAVEALFRHPLGLPIPHTALLPRNQQRAAQNVGRFFDTYFLDPAHLEPRIRALEPSTIAANWLSERRNSQLLASELSAILAHLLQQEPSRRTLVQLRRWLRGAADNPEADAAIAERLSLAVKDGVRGSAMGEMFGLVRRSISERRSDAMAVVKSRSRRWFGRGKIDDDEARSLIDSLLRLLAELENSSSEIRKGAQSAAGRMIDSAVTDGTLTFAVGQGRKALARSGALERTMFQLAGQMRDRLRRRIAEDPDAFSVPLADLIRYLAVRALADPQTRAHVDARVAEFAARLIGESRGAIAGYVTDVIAGWEPQELTERFEAELGPDLQYIRINGALLGALIGGVLFGLNSLLG